MSLVEPGHYSWQEAVDFIETKLPDKDATKSLIDAHAKAAAASSDPLDTQMVGVITSSVLDSKGMLR